MEHHKTDVEDTINKRPDAGHFAARLRALRQDRSLSLTDLAQISGVGRRTLSSLEAGEQMPQPRTVRKLAAALGVAPRELRG